HRRARPPAGGAPSRADSLALPADVRADLEHFIALAGEGESRPVDPVLRGLDILISAAFLLVLSPLLALTAVAIAVSSGRPVFYHGARVGRAGRLFRMYKFRT